VDFFYIHQMLEVGGVLAFHDFWLPGISKLVGFLRANFDYRVVETLPPGGRGLRWRWQKLARGAAALAEFALSGRETLFVHHPRRSPRGLGVLQKTSERRTGQDDFVPTW